MSKEKSLTSKAIVHEARLFVAGQIREGRTLGEIELIALAANNMALQCEILEMIEEKSK